MKVFRKPSSAEWYYDSAQLVDEQSIKVYPWTDETKIEFDATKNKSGDRHTTMKIIFNEEEIELLYNGLIKGRNDISNELRRVEIQLSQAHQKIDDVYDEIKLHVTRLDEEWDKTPADSDAESMLDDLRSPLKELLNDE